MTAVTGVVVLSVVALRYLAAAAGSQLGSAGIRGTVVDLSMGPVPAEIRLIPGNDHSALIRARADIRGRVRDHEGGSRQVLDRSMGPGIPRDPHSQRRPGGRRHPRS